MSWIQMTDTPTGLEVNFYDYQDKPPYGSLANPADGRDDVGDRDNFYLTNLASGLARNVPHTIRLEMTLIDGPRNDVVKVYVDGILKHTGTSWEDYFRWMQGPGDPEQTAPVRESRTVRTMLFRAGGAAAPATAGNGFVIDNLSLTSSTPVTPADTSWVFYDDGFPGGIGQLVVGPGTPPLGVGSVRLALPGTVGARQAYGTAAYAGTRLDKITKLDYYTYRSSVDAGNNLAIALQFDMDYDLTDANTAWQGRLVYEPYMGAGGTVLQNTWQQWDTLALAGKWWASGAPGNTLCPQASPCTMAPSHDKLAQCRARASVGYIWLKAGGPADGFDGNADALTVGVNSLDTTYDFEPTELKATTTDPLFCVGETTTVNIDLAGVANLYGYQFEVSYDQAKASATGVFVNSFFDEDGDGAVPTPRLAPHPGMPIAPPPQGRVNSPRVSSTRIRRSAAVERLRRLPSPLTLGQHPPPQHGHQQRQTEFPRRCAPIPHRGGTCRSAVCGLATVSGKVTLQGRFAGNVDAGQVTLTEQPTTNFTPPGSFPSPSATAMGRSSSRMCPTCRAQAPATRSRLRTACT